MERNVLKIQKNVLPEWGGGALKNEMEQSKSELKIKADDLRKTAYIRYTRRGVCVYYISRIKYQTYNETKLKTRKKKKKKKSCV